MTQAIFVALLACAVGVAGCTAADSNCAQPKEAFVQVLTERFNAGETTFDGYRLDAGGTLQRAAWTDGNRLIALSNPVELGAAAFASASATLKDTPSSEVPTPEPGMVPSRLVYTVSLASFVTGAGTDFKFRDRSSDTLEALMATWRASAPVRKPGSGRYVWTMPAPRNAGQPDVDMSRDDCQDPMGNAVSESYAAGLVAPVSAAVAQAFIEDGNTGRLRFIARAPKAFLYFGVLSAP